MPVVVKLGKWKKRLRNGVEEQTYVPFCFPYFHTESEWLTYCLPDHMVDQAKWIIL